MEWPERAAACRAGSRREGEMRVDEGMETERGGQGYTIGNVHQLFTVVHGLGTWSSVQIFAELLYAPVLLVRRMPYL